MNPTLAEQIRLLRREAGLTQKTVAASVHISEAHVSVIENGKREPSLDVLRRLAFLFNCDLEVTLRRRA